MIRLVQQRPKVVNGIEAVAKLANAGRDSMPEIRRQMREVRGNPIGQGLALPADHDGSRRHGRYQERQKKADQAETIVVQDVSGGAGEEDGGYEDQRK